MSGSVPKPGTYEVPFGTTLRSLLEMAGFTAAGSHLQAVLLGGAAGTFLRPDELDIKLTHEDTRAAGTTLGSGVVVAFDDSADMRDIVLRVAAFFRDGAWGQCGPGRARAVRQGGSPPRTAK